MTIAISTSRPRAWRILALAVAALAMGVPISHGDDPTKDTMRLKLRYTQSILEGIATENFALIETNAAHLSKLSQSAGWEVRNTAEYQHFTREFRQHVDRLAETARHRNVDAATVTYFQLTVSCVNCHKYLRESRLAATRRQLNPDSPL